MPETTKLDGGEESSAGTLDANIGVRKETELLARTPPAEAEETTEPAAQTAAKAVELEHEHAPELRLEPLHENEPAPELRLEPLHEHELALEPEREIEPKLGAVEPEHELEPKLGLEPELGLETSAHPEILEEANIRELAESVMSSLKEAGIETETNEGAQDFPDPRLPEDEAGVFAGWDELIDEPTAGDGLELEIQEEQAPAPPFEALIGGERSLSEIGLAAAALDASDQEGDAGEEQTSKHDELADAVQSALASIYGEPAPGVAKPASAAELRMRGTGWDAPGVIASPDDNLSPQDVILNYFSYESDAQKGDSGGAFNGAPLYDRGAGEDDLDREPYPPAPAQPQWTPSLARQGAYEGPASFPVPANLAANSNAAPSERESSRLLGAAAAGLIGGIAIAASLAVFVINSYGPGMRPGMGAGARALDASEQGYGRRLRLQGDEASTSGDVAAPVEQPVTIAVADSSATPGQPSALSIAVKPEGSADQALVSITGVPDGARLNAGVDAGGGNWLLPPHRLKGLAINLPPSASEPFLLGVQLLDSSVRTPLTEKKQFAVRLAAAKPEAASIAAFPSAVLAEASHEAPKPAQESAPSSFSTQTIPVPEKPAPRPEPQAQVSDATFRTQTIPAQASPAEAPRLAALAAPGFQPKGAPRGEIEDLIREGNKRMREGDILEARQLYQKAVVTGDPEAALAMGRSYDPIYFARIDKKNAEPDAAKAFDWYRKAMDAGAAQTAKVRIENLKHFLNE